MKAPPGLESLLEDGLIETVLRPLQSGKEAQIYLVIAGGEQRVAKIYKKATERNFKNRSEYAEGRGTRNTRDQRAMKRRSEYGKSRDEAAWQSTEVDMLYRLHHAGVRVPVPHFFSDGVLLMELVGAGDGVPAPRLGDLHFTAAEAIEIHDALLREVVRMLCAGVVHGDLSEFNVLVDSDGPVIIDLPQAVDASSNPNARKLLLRDVANLERFLARWAPSRPRKPFAAEMWALYEVNELEPDTELTGTYKGPEGAVDTAGILDLIDDATEDETQRRLGRGEKALARPSAGRVVINQDLRLQRRKSKSAGRRKPAPAPAPTAEPTRSKRTSLNDLINQAMVQRPTGERSATAPPQRREERRRGRGREDREGRRDRPQPRDGSASSWTSPRRDSGPAQGGPAPPRDGDAVRPERSGHRQDARGDGRRRDGESRAPRRGAPNPEPSQRRDGGRDRGTDRPAQSRDSGADRSRDRNRSDDAARPRRRNKDRAPAGAPRREASDSRPAVRDDRVPGRRDRNAEGSRDARDERPRRERPADGNRPRRDRDDAAPERRDSSRSDRPARRDGNREQRPARRDERREDRPPRSERPREGGAERPRRTAASEEALRESRRREREGGPPARRDSGNPDRPPRRERGPDSQRSNSEPRRDRGADRPRRDGSSSEAPRDRPRDRERGGDRARPADAPRRGADQQARRDNTTDSRRPAPASRRGDESPRPPRSADSDEPRRRRRRRPPADGPGRSDR